MNSKVLVLFLMTFLFSCQQEAEVKKKMYINLAYNVTDDIKYSKHYPQNLKIYLGFIDAQKSSNQLRIFDEAERVYPVDAAGLSKLLDNYADLGHIKKTNVLLHIDKSVPVAVMRYLEFLLIKKGKWAYRHVDKDGKYLRVYRDKINRKPCKDMNDCMSMHYFSQLDLSILENYKILPEENPIIYKDITFFSKDRAVFNYALRKGETDVFEFKKGMKEAFAVPKDPNEKYYHLNVAPDVSYEDYHQIHGTFKKMFTTRWEEISLLDFGKTYPELSEEEKSSVHKKLQMRVKVEFYEGC